MTVDITSHNHLLQQPQLHPMAGHEAPELWDRGAAHCLPMNLSFPSPSGQVNAMGVNSSADLHMTCK